MKLDKQNRIRIPTDLLVATKLSGKRNLRIFVMDGKNLMIFDGNDFPKQEFHGTVLLDAKGRFNLKSYIIPLLDCPCQEYVVSVKEHFIFIRWM